MIIYLDREFKCHTADTGGMRAHETSFFDGRCRAYIEGFCCVPQGESCNGTFAVGDMFFPWTDISILEAAQAEYEEMLAMLSGLAAKTAGNA